MPKYSAQIPAPLIGQLDSRDAAIWLAGAEEGLGPLEAADLCRLPWNVVLCERTDAAFVSALEAAEPIDGPLVRRRGLIHVVDTDPADNSLPPRHLAALLLNGKGEQRRAGIAALTRRLTMLQYLRRRSVRQLVIAVTGTFTVPEDLSELWSDGFRTTLLFVSDDPAAPALVSEWKRRFSVSLVDLIQLSPADFNDALQQEYIRGRDDNPVVRMRDEKGAFRLVDVSGLDEPERPILASYELLSASLLAPLMPSDLSLAEVEGFFSDPEASWRPYAAGIVWQRDNRGWDAVRSRLRSLDKSGPEESRIMFVTAEPGAGATAFLRDLAWRTAAEGYPTLVATRGPVTQSSLDMSGYLTRLINAGSDRLEQGRLYEAPCVIVFDQSHWAGREPDLVSFLRDIQRSGRRVCILVATGPAAGMGILSERRYVELAALSHRVTLAQALSLGRHLNRFLAPHGTARSDEEWRSFFETTAVSASHGVAAFWIVLSFWLQRQIDLTETVQSKIYNLFKNCVDDQVMRIALIRIAAFSTVREPLPDDLLPSTDGWPIADRIEDLRKTLGALGLVRVRGEFTRYWAMAHNLLGRYLLNALFYDYSTRITLGYGSAQNPEHLRFLVLTEISAAPVLQTMQLREVADAFAVSIFKIDPDHGHATLVPYWREVLAALDKMPRAVRTTSRAFLHHCSISRRRIASDRDLFEMSNGERIELLRRAVSDLRAALGLDLIPGGESDLNLYNSLAHALHDLADVEAAAGLDSAVVSASRAAAHEATRRAYALNPDNTFVVETYARTLLAEGAGSEEFRVHRALEVLNLVYGLFERPGFDARRNALLRLAEQAFDLLMEGGGAANEDPNTEPGAIATALAALWDGVYRPGSMPMREIPRANRIRASQLLAAPVISGNVQAVKLRYILAVIDTPNDFDLQLELLQSLYGAGPAFTPQMELELAVLMFQKDRPHEGDRVFRKLRSLWRRGEHYVEVPAHLHWLLNATRSDRRQVRARVVSNLEGRAVARVAEFQNIEVLFRPAEFGQVHPVAGTAMTAFVSFGHNGPLLRPLTAAKR